MAIIIIFHENKPEIPDFDFQHPILRQPPFALIASNSSYNLESYLTDIR